MIRAAIFLSALSISTAAWGQMEPDPFDSPSEPVPPVVQPAPEPAVAPAPPADPPFMGDDRADDDDDARGPHHDHRGHGRNRARPRGLTLGLGFGYAFPNVDWTTPNVATARLRLPSGLTIEPAFQLSRTGTKSEAGPIESNDTAHVLALAGLVRFPIVSSRKLDLVGAGAAILSTTSDDPDGPNNATTTTTFGLGYGIAIEYWWRPHINISVTTINPIVTYTKIKQDGAGGDVSTASTTFGLIFDPSVILMGHLFFD